MLCWHHFRIIRHSLRILSAESCSGTTKQTELNCKYRTSCSDSKNTEMKSLHKPVMVEEVVDILHPEPGESYLDMTFGAGGHTKALLQRQSDLKIYALDRDPDAFKVAIEMSQQKPNIVPLLGRFSDLAALLDQHRVEANSFDGVLFDVGASSMQFDSGSRGFALSKDCPLDMRMDKDRLPDHPTAADVLNTIEEDKLSKIIEVYGHDKMAKEIARAVVEQREHIGHITTTGRLADTVASAVKGSYRKNKLRRNAHVATKTFQALRIFVNNELNELYHGIEAVHRFLKPGGLCVVIVFHSLEERVVKRLFLNRTGKDKDRESYRAIHEEQSDLCSSSNNTSHGHQIRVKETGQRWKSLSKVALAASEEEIYRNPRARSARIRAAVKL